jgi:hypothetical protein
MRLEFDDGVSFDTSGGLRIESKWDGLYVVGKGHLIPVDSFEKGIEYIQKLKERGSVAQVINR